MVLQRPAGSTNDTEVYDAVFADCENTTGVTIQTEEIPSDGYLAKILQQVSSKTMPDILMLDNGDLPQIAQSGALAALSDFGVSADGFAEGVVAASSYEGELYGIQPVANTIALFVNPELLAAAGVEVPTTWDELKTASAALTQGETYGMAFSAAATEEGTFQFLPFFWSNGADEADVASPEAAEALQLWVDLVDAGAASESVLTWTQADVNDQFIAGKAAMMVNGPWQFPSLDEAAVPYEVVAIPAPRAGEEIVSPLGGETWTVPNTGDEASMASAAEVVACLASDESQLALAEGRDLVPTKVSLTDQYVASNPKMAGFAVQVPGLRARTAKLGADYTVASQQIHTAIQTALTGGAEPLAAFEQAAQS
ncbi:sugar ABC transporter substrate-binding protein [Cellulomonas endophytica]|uniref:sugar ABC transporter substrate-binding protein n=1 Tax=Cellulomonas endophytica TaxID=2494735 RepID=UPI001F0B780D|nr:sugar ABC transporter substrate-binding protein [Cellulomonas endophytica]